MGKIKYCYYDNCSNYPTKDNSKKRGSISISEWELEKYALLNGLINGHILSKEGKNFYSSFHKMAIKEDDKSRYLCTADYKCAEPSYKVTISFALGMLATRIIALKKYDIIHLFHLKDNSIKYFPKNGKVPDWFGIDSHGIPFLFESKGSDRASIRKAKMEEAENQLKAIDCVIDTGYGKTYFKADFKKHAIVSCIRFDRKNKINRWYIQDVDPVGEGTIDITLDLNYECFKYYKTFISFLDSFQMPYEEIEIKQQKYYFLFFENGKLGIHKSIYDAVVSGNYIEKNVFENFHNDIKRVLDTIKCEKYMEDSSSFEDGIIVCSSEKKFN